MFFKRSYVVYAAVAAVVAWSFLRPDRIAELTEVDSRLVGEAAALLPQFKSTVSKVTLKYREQSSGAEFQVRAVKTAVSPLVGRTDRKTYHPQNNTGVLEESSLLNIGPVALIRHVRVPIPVFGDLLPNFNWGTMKLTAIQGSPNPEFPWVVGSAFIALVDYDHFYTSGEKSHVEQLELVCIAREKIAANTLHPSFRGEAVKVECRSSNNRYGPPDEVETKESWYLREPEIIVPASYRFDKSGLQSANPGADVQTTKVIGAEFN